MTDTKGNIIGEKLKDFFAQRGITQEDIARELGVSQAYVSSMLNGKPFGKNTAKKWGELYGIQPSWLLTGDGDMLVNGSKEEKSSNVEPNNSLDILAKAIETLSESEKTNTKNIQELIAQGREQTSNITKLVDLLCQSGIISENIISPQEKREPFSERDTDEDTAYNAGSANVG